MMPAEGWSVIRADRMLDGRGAVVERPVLAVHAGTIAHIRSGHEPRGPWPADAPVIDLRGQTLLPGLIDAHVHLVLPGDGTPFETTVQERDEVLTLIAAQNCRRALEAGITTVRDCGGMRDTTLALRRAQALGCVDAPRLHLCGRPLTVTGGHCWYFGGEADGPEALRAAVRGLLKAGADYIKIMASGGGTAGTISWRPSYSAAELAAAVDEARRFERRVGIHCLCADATRNALAAGADQIEHANFLADRSGRQAFEPAVADALARAGTPVTATLAVAHYVVRWLEAACRTRDQALLDRWRRMLASNVENARRMRAAGVRFVAGTDAGWRYTPFDALVTELQLLCDAGASTADAIAAATSAPAAAMGIGHETGALREGLAADVIAVPGDPRSDLELLRRPSFIMARGAIVAGRPAGGVPAGRA